MPDTDELTRLRAEVAQAAADMRERCAQVASGLTCGTPVGAGDGCGTMIPSPISGQQIAAAIRAIPTEPQP